MNSSTATNKTLITQVSALAIEPLRYDEVPPCAGGFAIFRVTSPSFAGEYEIAVATTPGVEGSELNHDSVEALKAATIKAAGIDEDEYDGNACLEIERLLYDRGIDTMAEALADRWADETHAEDLRSYVDELDVEVVAVSEHHGTAKVSVGLPDSGVRVQFGIDVSDKELTWTFTQGLDSALDELAPEIADAAGIPPAFVRTRLQDLLVSRDIGAEAVARVHEIWASTEQAA